MSAATRYVFDYGDPGGFRLAMACPERVTAIISQNGNAYEEGLGRMGSCQVLLERAISRESRGNSEGSQSKRHTSGIWKPPCTQSAGKQDLYFIAPGAEAFRRDNPNATVQFLDSGHFALETHVEEIALAMREFLAKLPLKPASR